MPASFKAIGLTALIAAGSLTGCARAVVSADEMVAQCEIEAAPAGTYEYDPTTAIPVMTPVKDGTAAGARKFNSCIRAKAADAGMIPLTSASGSTGATCPDGAATLFGGATYCIRTH